MIIIPGKQAILAALVASAATAVFVWNLPSHSQSATQAAQSGADDARLQALESRLESLSAEVHGLALLSASPRQAGRLTPGQVEQLEKEASSPGLLETERDRRFSGFDAAFRREPVDAQWGPATERSLGEVGMTDAILSIDAMPPTQKRIDCRSRTCRLDFLFSRSADATDWSLAYVTGVGKNLTHVQYAIQTRPDGSARVLMFGKR